MLDCSAGCLDKKLKEAAAHWAADDTSIQEDADFFNADKAVFETPDFEVHPDAWPALSAFFYIDDCWVRTEQGARQRLSWQDAKVVWEGLNICLTPRQFEHVTILVMCTKEVK